MNKKILVTQSSMPSYEEYCKEIKPLFDSKWLTNNGCKHQELEGKLKDFLRVDNLSLFVNGHLALLIAIKSFNFKPGSEIITTPYTFSSTIHAIVDNGLKPVFCDINEDDYTIDVEKIEKLITDKTVAILPVHVYGHICNVEKIDAISKKHHLKVIYDAAHVFGVEYKNKSIASYGDVSMFSFHATKVFNTIEGGALVYQDIKKKDIIEKLKNFGINGAEKVEYVGMNAKMNEFQAAMGICNLRHFAKEMSKRKKVYEHYIERLQNIDGIKISLPRKDVKFNYAYFPIVFDKKKFGMDRDEVKDLLEKENIYTRKYFYPIASEYDCYKEYYNSNLTPIAKSISENILTLPMYADLKIADVDRICDIILGGNK